MMNLEGLTSDQVDICVQIPCIRRRVVRACEPLRHTRTTRPGLVSKPNTLIVHLVLFFVLPFLPLPSLIFFLSLVDS